MIAIIDKWLGKWASRKLIVFFIATIFAVFKIINGTEWIYISLGYMFVQGSIDALEYFKGKK